MHIPSEFVSKIKLQHPSVADKVIESLVESSVTLSVRLNRLKNYANISNPVAWCQHAMYLDERPSFTMDAEFHAGAYYVQEASSMIIYHILKQLSLAQNPYILDLCAAPGGKSTLILDYLENKGLLVANEVIKARASVLEENIIKWGYGNAVVSNNDPKDFAYLPGFFDTIVVDAPCSGEGMFRKDESAINEWSLNHINHCALRQQRIIADVIPALKNNGYLIYSTCTFNHEENISNIESFIQQYGLKSIDIEMKEEWGITKIEKGNAIGYQFFPGITRGEGFFVAVLQKQAGENYSSLQKIKKPKLQKLPLAAKEILNDWVKADEVHLLMTERGNVYAYTDQLAINIEQFLHHLTIKYSGTLLGNLQKKVFIPDHALAMSKILSCKIKEINLTRKEALQYLNRSLAAVDSPHQSWLVAKYNGFSLGWLKNLGNRINNYYPTEWRIKKDISSFIE